MVAHFCEHEVLGRIRPQLDPRIEVVGVGRHRHRPLRIVRAPRQRQFEGPRRVDEMFAQVLDNRRSVLLRQQGKVTDSVRIIPAAQVKRLLFRKVQGIQVHAQWKPLAPLNGLHDDLALIRARLHVSWMEGQPHLPSHARGHGDRIPIVLGRNLRQGRRHRHPSPRVGPSHLVNGHILGIVAAGQPAQAERHLHRFVTAVAHIERRGAVLLAHQVHLDGQFRRCVGHADEVKRIPQVRRPERERLQAFGAPEPRLRAQHPFVPWIQR